MAAAAGLQVPQRDVERRQRKHHRSATTAVVQAPPDVMPDGFGVVGLASLDQCGDFAPENVGDGAAIAADGVGIAHAFGAIGIAHATAHELERCDFSMRAVGERDGERDPVESGLGCRDACHSASTRGFSLEAKPTGAARQCSVCWNPVASSRLDRFKC